MAQVVRLKRSAVTGNIPSAGDVELGELAINTYDGKIFFERDDGTPSIQEIITTNAHQTGSIDLSGSIYISDSIGIGTNSPNSLFHISGSSSGDSIGAYIENAQDASSFINLKNSEGEFSLFTNSGTFGIYDVVNTSTRLSIKSDGTIDINGAVSSSTGFAGNGSQLTNLPTQDPFPYTGSAIISGALDVIGDFAVDGSIGIGTSNTSDRLHISGSVVGGSMGVFVENAESAASIMRLKNSGGDYAIFTSTGNLTFFDFTTSSSKLSIASDGSTNISGSLSVGGLYVTDDGNYYLSSSASDIIVSRRFGNGNFTIRGGVDINASSPDGGDLYLEGGNGLTNLGNGDGGSVHIIGGNSTSGIYGHAYIYTRTSGLGVGKGFVSIGANSDNSIRSIVGIGKKPSQGSSYLIQSSGSWQHDSPFDMNSHIISNVQDPTGSQDAATKNYIDNLEFTASIVEEATVTGSYSNTSSFTVTHNFGTKNVFVHVYDDSDNQIIPQTINLADSNSVDITLSSNGSGFAIVGKAGHIVSGTQADDLAFGTSGEIPYTNGTTDDFNYTSSFSINNSILSVGAGQASTSNTTGTVIVTGGVGVSGDINAGGDVVAYASSDERLKNNIIPIENSIDKINKIGGYSFIWDESRQKLHKGKDYGVIAQEIESILPELVETRDTGYKAVKYDKIIPLLIEGIKELSNEVNELKKRLE